MPTPLPSCACPVPPSSHSVRHSHGLLRVRPAALRPRPPGHSGPQTGSRHGRARAPHALICSLRLSCRPARPAVILLKHYHSDIAGLTLPYTPDTARVSRRTPDADRPPRVPQVRTGARSSRALAPAAMAMRMPGHVRAFRSIRGSWRPAVVPRCGDGMPGGIAQVGRGTHAIADRPRTVVVGVSEGNGQCMP